MSTEEGPPRAKRHSNGNNRSYCAAWSRINSQREAHPSTNILVRLSHMFQKIRLVGQLKRFSFWAKNTWKKSGRDHRLPRNRGEVFISFFLNVGHTTRVYLLPCLLPSFIAHLIAFAHRVQIIQFSYFFIMGFLPECNLTCAFLLHSFTFPIAHCPSFSWAFFFFTIRPPFFPKLALVCTIFS